MCVCVDKETFSKLILHNNVPADMYSGVVISLNTLDVTLKESKTAFPHLLSKKTSRHFE